MSNSFKNRVIKALQYGSCMFIWMIVLEKLVLKEEQWLVFSIVDTIFYTIGIFVSETVEEKIVDKAKKDILYISVSIFVTLLVVLITGPLLSLENWFEIDIYACVSFIVALIFNRASKN